MGRPQPEPSLYEDVGATEVSQLATEWRERLGVSQANEEDELTPDEVPLEDQPQVTLGEEPSHRLIPAVGIGRLPSGPELRPVGEAKSSLPGVAALPGPGQPRQSQKFALVPPASRVSPEPPIALPRPSQKSKQLPVVAAASRVSAQLPVVAAASRASAQLPVVGSQQRRSGQLAAAAAPSRISGVLPELAPPPRSSDPSIPGSPMSLRRGSESSKSLAVEVKDDKHVVDKAADDAKQLSDKNRDVAEETRATQTNLDHESEGQAVASRESDDHQSAEVGGPDDRIRQLEEAQATTDQHIRETDHSGRAETAKGAIRGEGGDNGQEGTGERDPGLLAMRGIGGRGALTEVGRDGRKIGKHGLPGVATPLAFKDYERIVGKDHADEERQVAARKLSSKKGRWEKKLDAVRSALENFVPDIRPGNQTALKTRAHPYALYIARMHRRIHELWGFGFLEQLDDRGADYPLNDPNLWVNLEISVNPDGSLHKVMIAKTSGKTEFDVAAVDAVISSGPYEATPEAIRSVDGRIYLRWGFYRNWRQCGTFNAEPYILTEVPDDGGVGVLDDGAMVKNIAKLPGSKRAGGRPATPGPLATADDGLGNQKVSPDSNVHDREATFAANQWVAGFSTARVEKLVARSTVPFRIGPKVIQSLADLKEIYAGLLVESGPLKQWKPLTAAEFPQAQLAATSIVIQVQTTKETFYVVLDRQASGEYRASQLAR